MPKPAPTQRTERLPDGSYRTVFEGHNYKTAKPATEAEIEAFEAAHGDAPARPVAAKKASKPRAAAAAKKAPKRKR